MIANNSNFWIDRLFTSKDAHLYQWDELKKKVNHIFTNFVLAWFNHPIYSKTLIVRNLSQRLKRVRIETSIFRFWKGIITIVCLMIGVGVYVLTTKSIISTSLAFPVILGLVGFIAPELYLIEVEQQKEYEIHTDFPRFLDLLHLYTASAAFEHIGNAIHEVSTTMQGALAVELQDLTTLYRFVDLHTFLDKFEERFSSPLARDLVSTIRLADAYGGSLSTKIGLLAEESHKERLQNAKKAGQRSSAALLIPLMLFHFPVAVVIFLAPTAIALKAVFGW